MAKSAEHPDVCRLREKSLWIDVQGRLILVYQRHHQGSSADYRCVSVDILLLGKLIVKTRPYDELVSLIRSGKMKYSGELNFES